VVIATGAQYNKPRIANLDQFEGQGIYYGATYMEAQLCEQEEIIVVGGGNSAGQAAVFLSQTARKVYMLVRSSGLSDTMSRYLIQRIEENPAIELHYKTEIVGVDGGTHLERTGQAGLLLIRKPERRRDLWRVEFVCGYRALAAARGDFAALGQAASLLSCGLPDVPAVLAKTIEEKRGLHSAAKRLEERLAEHEARGLLAGAAEKAGGVRIIARVLEEATPGYLGLVAEKLVSEGGVVVLLAGRGTGHVVFAQSKGFASDMGALLRETIKEFGGKGGGAKDFAQGTIPDPAKADELLGRAAERLKK